MKQGFVHPGGAGSELRLERVDPQFLYAEPFEPKHHEIHCPLMAADPRLLLVD